MAYEIADLNRVFQKFVSAHNKGTREALIMSNRDEFPISLVNFEKLVELAPRTGPFSEEDKDLELGFLFGGYHATFDDLLGEFGLEQLEKVIDKWLT